MGYNRKALFTCRRRVRYGGGAVRGACGAAPPRVGGAAAAKTLAHALTSGTYPILGITASHHIMLASARCATRRCCFRRWYACMTSLKETASKSCAAS
eukprot:5063501-Pleurochrysis_carterae.AAC.1